MKDPIIIDLGPEDDYLVVRAPGPKATVLDVLEGHSGQVLYLGPSRARALRALGPLVGPGEIAQRLQVEKDTVHKWRTRGLLPEPDEQLAAGPVWLWSTIEEWAQSTGRLEHSCRHEDD